YPEGARAWSELWLDSQLLRSRPRRPAVRRVRQLPPAREGICRGRFDRPRHPRLTVTERLYYTDPYLTEFDAQVLDVPDAGAGRRAIVLDRTAFYPSSGGQPFDTGEIGSTKVVDVIDREDGVILHVVDGLPEAGQVRGIEAGLVHGRIDWARRFDHMQQHT